MRVSYAILPLLYDPPARRSSARGLQSPLEPLRMIPFHAIIS